MTMRLYPFAIPLMMLLAACRPGTAEYTESEAPNRLTVDSAATRVDVRFVAGSARLAVGEGARLARLAATGAMRPSDRVTISPAGAPWLAQRRALTVSHELLRYGIVVTTLPLATVPRDDAILEIGRYLVTLPRCPNWSKPPGTDFTNASMSNLGCATASNLGEMVASPADLASGRPLGAVDGTPAVGAVQRYLAEKVALPASNSALPVASAAAPAPGASGGTQ